jgi:hypothetical protein
MTGVVAGVAVVVGLRLEIAGETAVRESADCTGKEER